MHSLRSRIAIAFTGLLGLIILTGHIAASEVATHANSSGPAPAKPQSQSASPGEPLAPSSSNTAARPEVTHAIPTLALGFDLKNATTNAAVNSTNTPAVPVPTAPAGHEESLHQLDAARYLRNTARQEDAIPMLESLLGEKSPDFIKKAALLELGAIAEDGQQLGRAQQIYSQYAQKWPDDQYLPEVLLRQGHIFRRQGLNKMALAKFYAVMTCSLVLRHDQFDYYARLVIEAQTQIAQTHFELEKFAEAADFYQRLLKQDSPFINRPEAQFRLVACLVHTSKFEDAVSQGFDFLARYPTSPDQPEIRFHLASALKQLGRNNEALTQVLSLLREQSAQAGNSPETWAYWQQRTGNLIANQLFREGDYTRALELYINLSHLNPSPAWQLPVAYQIGQTYERLWQPQKAVDTYSQIVNREKELGTNPPPGLVAVVDMARWRIGFVQWQTKAENFTHGISTNTNPTNNISAPVRPPPAPTVASNPSEKLAE